MAMQSRAWGIVAQWMCEWLRPERMEPGFDDDGTRLSMDTVPSDWLIQAAAARVLHVRPPSLPVTG